MSRTRSVTRSPPTCSREAATFARCRRCSGTPTFDHPALHPPVGRGAEGGLLQGPSAGASAGRPESSASLAFYMPERPRWRRSAARLEPELVGRRIEKVSVLDERLTRPEPPRLSREGGNGSRGRGRRPPRQVPADRARRRADPRHPPADDRQPPLREAGDGVVADLMETELLGGPRLYESSPEPSHGGPVRARRRA